MRVLFYTFSFPPKVDGVISRVLNTLVHLHAEGHVLRVATPQQPRRIPDWMPRAGIAIDHWAGLRLPMYPEQWMGNPINPRAVFQIVRSLREFRPDIVHLVGPDPIHWAVVAVCNLLRIPTVVSYHTDVMSYAARYGVPRWAVRGLQAGYGWSWIDRVIATSPSFRQRLLDDHRIRCDAVWPAGVDTSIFYPRAADPALRVRLTGGRPERFLFLYAGRFSREKDLTTLLRIFEPFTEAALALIGGGPDQSFRSQKLGDRLYVSEGFWSQAELARAYASADAFITASCSETLGFSVLEAMASGRPIIAPAAQGLTDLVQHEQRGLLFAPGDIADAQRQITRLIADPALHTRLCEQALAHAGTLSWPSATRWLSALYREVLTARTERAQELGQS